MVITGGYCFKEVVNYVEKGVSSAVDAVLDLFDGLQVVARSGNCTKNRTLNLVYSIHYTHARMHARTR